MLKVTLGLASDVAKVTLGLEKLVAMVVMTGEGLIVEKLDVTTGLFSVFRGKLGPLKPVMPFLTT